MRIPPPGIDQFYHTIVTVMLQASEDLVEIASWRDIRQQNLQRCYLAATWL
jgi:hypothetical protein